MLARKILTMDELPETTRIFDPADVEENAEFRRQEKKMAEEAEAKKNGHTRTDRRHFDIWKNN